MSRMIPIAVKFTGLALAFISMSKLSEAREPCTPINFSSGESSAIVEGIAPVESIVCYTLKTGANQNASIEVTDGLNIVFSILGIVDAQDRYSFRTEATTYEIQVSQLMRSVKDEPFVLAVRVGGGSTLDQVLDVPFAETSGDGQAAWCGSSIVSGLDPNGDGFLAVRSGPGTEYRKIDQAYNGDTVSTCDARGSWVAIVYGPSKKKGWVHSRWLKHVAG